MAVNGTPEPRLHLVHRMEPELRVLCPSCSSPLPTRLVSEIWVEVRKGDGWVAAYGIVAKAGMPTIAEARLFPDERRRKPGAWSGRPASVPRGGIPGRVLGSLRLTDVRRFLPEVIDNWDRETAGYVRTNVLKRFGLSRTGRVASRRPGRKGRPDRYYATWAAAYVERLEDGSRTPVKDLSISPPIQIGGYVSGPEVVSGRTIGDILTEARKRGLLTDSPAGRAGGELTAKARRLLR